MSTNAFVRLATLAAGAAIALAVAVPAQAATHGPSGAHLISTAYGGSGCPQGTVAVALSSDKNTLTVLYDSFTAAAGPGVPLTEGRKTCQLSLDVSIPARWQYAVTSVTYRGFVQLGAGATANRRGAVTFSGQVASESFDHLFTGPRDNDYTTTVTTTLGATIWSPCGTAAPLNVNEVSSVTSVATEGILTGDTTDGKVHSAYGLAWRTC